MKEVLGRALFIGLGLSIILNVILSVGVYSYIFK